MYDPDNVFRLDTNIAPAAGASAAPAPWIAADRHWRAGHNTHGGTEDDVAQVVAEASIEAARKGFFASGRGEAADFQITLPPSGSLDLSFQRDSQTFETGWATTTQPQNRVIGD